MTEHDLRGEIQRISVKFQMNPRTTVGDAHYKAKVRDQLVLFAKINQINGWQDALEDYDKTFPATKVLQAFELVMANFKKPKGTPKIFCIVGGERSERIAMVMGIEALRTEPLPLDKQQQTDFLNSGYLYNTKLGHLLFNGIVELMKSESEQQAPL